MNDDKPPSETEYNQNIMGFSSRLLSSLNIMARRFKNAWAVWGSPWDIPPIRSPILGRCPAIFADISKS